MQVNYNYNWQECIGGGFGLVQRNLWSYLESEPLTPTTKLYDSGSGIWYDNGRYNNNAFVNGNFGTITENTGSYGGYNISFSATDWLYWPSQYYDGPVPYSTKGQCVFIQWQSSATYTSSVSLFNNTSGSTSTIAFWGGRNLLSGNSYEYVGWPQANEFTTNQNPLLDLTNKDAMYMQLLGTPDGPGYNIMAYNTGVGMGVSGSQVFCSPYDGPDSPGNALAIKNNSFAGGFDFENQYLLFGKQGTMPASFVGDDGSNNAYAFKGTVKRILIYNSTLSTNEILQNWSYLRTLP